MLNGCYLRNGAEFYIAINNKGLWPNLTMLLGGEIGAVVYNQPSHGYGEGDFELWVSSDGDTLWELRSVVSDHGEDPELVRMNHAVGLNANGDLVVLVSGHSAGRRPPTLPVQVCISSDGGETWRRQVTNVPHIPFGDIVCKPDGTLVSAMYTSDPADVDSRPPGVVLLASEDDGLTWNEWQRLPGNYNETALLRCSDGRWLAAMRTLGPVRDDVLYYSGGPLQLTTSEDEGETWSSPLPVSLPCQHPAHLLELHDRRILLTYGSRIPGQYGVVVRLSDDHGESWSMPEPLISVSVQTDCGYPSSVQLEDGLIVTAYYFGKQPHTPEGAPPSSVPWHHHYHMGVARWHTG